MKRMKRWYTNFLGLVTGLAVAGQYEIPEAVANDDKVFAPQSCVSVTDDELPAPYNFKFFESSLVNNDDEPRDIVCPLIRDNLKDGIQKVWVRLDNHDNISDVEETRCCIYSFSPLAGYSDFKCKEADNSKYEQSIEITGVKSWDDGHYALRCTLEYGDSIFSYRISEP